MKVIFLDHFGVMCLPKEHGRTNNYDDYPSASEFKGIYADFDKEAIDILNHILEITNSDIVISSDCKYQATLEEIQLFYKKQGIIRQPFCFTPPFTDIEVPNDFAWDDKLRLMQQRYFEVAAYVDAMKIAKWVCVDDMHVGNTVNGVKRNWGLTNFVWISRSDEGIKQQGIKEKIVDFLHMH